MGRVEVRKQACEVRCVPCYGFSDGGSEVKAVDTFPIFPL